MDADDPGSTDGSDGGPSGERGEPGAGTLAELATAGDHPDAVALRTAGADPEREYDYGRLRTDARKSGNLLAALGVREGRTLAVDDDPPVPEAVLALLGAGLLGAVVRFDPPTAPDARAVLAPADRVGAYDLPPGGQRVAYGGEPDDPTVTHFERAMWSENPTFPPPTVAPGDPLLSTGEETHSHRAVLREAGRIAAEFDIRPGDEVAVRAPLGLPEVVVAGVVAPLRVGATVLLARDSAGAGTVAVTSGGTSVPEPRAVDPGVAFD